MEEYTRESLRELRKNEKEARQQLRREKGSKFITLLIILLFLGAGAFYLATAKPTWLTKHFDFSAIGETLKGWREGITTAFQPKKDAEEIKSTVDSALATQGE